MGRDGRGRNASQSAHMILTCPSCATSYFTPDEAIGAGGRTVRCKSCKHTWRATLEEPLELSVSPPGVEPASFAPRDEPPAESLAETPAPELPRAFRARAEQQRRVRRAATHGAVWAGLASVFVALIVSAWLFRVEVVETFPRAAAAYAMVGSPVNPVGLDFEAMAAKEAPEHPGMVLVSGALRNVRDQEIVAPPVRVALLDAHGAEVGFKIIRIDAAPVLPGRVQGFAALIPDPGGHAADIGVNFVPASAHEGKAEVPAPAAPPRKAPSAPINAPSHPPAPVPVLTPTSAHEGGLRPASAPGVGGAAMRVVEARPIDAGPLRVVDTGHGEAVSPSHHG